jgi:hypothetical protein
VKNNLLSKHDRETVVKLFEEYEFESSFIRKTNSLIFRKKKNALIREFEKTIPLDNYSGFNRGELLGNNNSQGENDEFSVIKDEVENEPSTGNMEESINSQSNLLTNPTNLYQESITSRVTFKEQSDKEMNPGEDSAEGGASKKSGNEKTKKSTKSSNPSKKDNYTPFSSIESFIDVPEEDNVLSPISRKKRNQIGYQGPFFDDDDEEDEEEDNQHNELEEIADNLSEFTDLESIDKHQELTFIV